QEDLPVDTLARPLVQRIRDDADDFDVQRRLGTVAEPDVLAERALAGKEMFRELTVDDRDGRLFLFVAHLFGIPDPEVAPLEQRNLHRLEVARRDAIHE